MVLPRLVMKRLQSNCQARLTDQQSISAPELPIFHNMRFQVGTSGWSIRPLFRCIMSLLRLSRIYYSRSPTVLNRIDVPPAVGNDKRTFPSTAKLPRPQSTVSKILMILPFDLRAYGELSYLSTCRFLSNPFLNGGKASVLPAPTHFPDHLEGVDVEGSSGALIDCWSVRRAWQLDCKRFTTTLPNVVAR
ncbi:hypothetical protein CSKR_112494 [Clonorchis sinensis]|uniref:Uncharacterized protein n=1 Tax=Clonorchis sinensis TaxID=79923 RepID=A0A3R7G966_CLOSI|nr:hypothetical protein CSKR_112494 [Clonorchis sinensis]